jgi:crotonobetaine/carnitine-CoA ligase
MQSNSVPLTSEIERGIATHTFTGQDVWQLVLLRAKASTDRPFLVWNPFDGPGRTWTYGELARDAAAIAVGMTKRGVKPGDRVLVHMENCPEFVIAWCACAAVGAVAVTTNTRSVGEELKYFADDSGAVGAFTQPKFAEVLSTSAPGLRWMVVTDNDAGAPSSVRSGVDAFGTLLADAPDDLAAREIDPMAPMSVQYTSGTTSRPKGVVWTHANALWAGRVNASHEGLRPDDCHLVYMPLFHTNALSYSMLASLWTGSRFVLLPKWSSSRFWDVSLRHGCTWLSLMALAYRSLMTSDVPAGHKYRQMGFGLCDTPLDARLGAKTVGWFGMTETVSHPTIGSPYLPDRPMSMGRVAPEYEIAVVAEDGRRRVEAEETGQLLVRGVRGLSLFAEYLNQPSITADSFDEDGWFATGDLVKPHADGYISYADRQKDVLRVGAENVSTSEVERVLLQTGLIREVAVVGRFDKKLDEVPVAFVVPHKPSDGMVDRLLEACQAQLADFKVPREIYAVREMPRSTLAKINKVQLRAVAAVDADRESAEQRWLQEASVDPSGDAVQ